MFHWNGADELSFQNLRKLPQFVFQAHYNEVLLYSASELCYHHFSPYCRIQKQNSVLMVWARIPPVIRYFQKQFNPMRICVEAPSTFIQTHTYPYVHWQHWKIASKVFFFPSLAHIDSLAVVLLFSYTLVIVLFALVLLNIYRVKTGESLTKARHTRSVLLGGPSVWSIVTLHLIKRTYIISYRDKYTQVKSNQLKLFEW